MRLQYALRALSSRNLRYFFAGQGISLVGTWVQLTAMSWLVYRLTGSALLLGVTGFTSQIPSLFLAPIAGVLADRWNLRRIVLWTQTLALFQASVLATVVLLGTVRVWHIVALSLISGIINAFDIPARQSFLVEMVDEREDLANAIALNSSMVNAGRLVGPSIGGLLISALGEGVCFALNAVSYLAVILVLSAMRTRRRLPQQPSGSVVAELREGFSYAFGYLPVRYLLLLIGLASLLSMPYSVLMPVYARDILHGDARTFGILMSSTGAGALLGTVYLASRRSVLGLDRVIALTTTLFGVGLLFFAVTRHQFLSMILLVVIGFGAMAMISSSNAVLQTVVDDDKRGRVMSIYIMALVGLTPFGSIMAGYIAHVFGVQRALLMCGCSCVFGGILFAMKLPVFRSHVRPVYMKKGILRDIQPES